MKVQNINSSTSFHAGLTKKMQREILNTDVQKVSSQLLRQGIESDFKNNKTVAWCSLKCIDIIKTFNTKFNLNFGLPNGIFVEDFYKLNIQNPYTTAMATFTSGYAYSDKSRITPEKTIFFNEVTKYNYKNGNAFWENIDSIADQHYEQKAHLTNFFLEYFIHEFFHVAHADNMIKNHGNEKTISTLLKVTSPQYLHEFQTQIPAIFKNDCPHSTSSPLELVVFDLIDKFMVTLDKKQLVPKTNFIENTPYDIALDSFETQGLKQLNPSEKLLRNFWNGIFDLEIS